MQKFYILLLSLIISSQIALADNLIPIKITKILDGDTVEAVKIPYKNASFKFQGIDRYGRALGILYLDKININELLKEKGGPMIYDY